MRVLFCSYQAVANPGGGVFVQIMMTKKYLEKIDVNVELFNPWKRYKWKDFDIIHVFETDMRNYFLLKMLPTDIRLVVSPIIDKTFLSSVARILTLISNRLPPQIVTSYKSHAVAFQKANIVIARSSQERRMLVRGFGVHPKRIRDVPNGVEEKFVEAKADLFNSKYNIKKFVLYVGQIGNPRKNLICLLKVARQLKDVPFVLVGPILETPYAKQVLEFARNLENVHVLGRLPQDVLLSAYSACEVFVLPSLVEGTGLVALEAGLAGAKVVITNRGGPPDYFKDVAILVKPTCASIRKGIEEALQKPRDEKLRRHILENFTWSKIVKKLVNVYRDIV